MANAGGSVAVNASSAPAIVAKTVTMRRMCFTVSSFVEQSVGWTQSLRRHVVNCQCGHAPAAATI
jgi:hypothetical protein